jgi:CubicO group peptidase (beta-lactamase class C family)
MRLISQVSLALGLTSTLSWAQNCPLLGPAYLAPTNLASPTFIEAKSTFEKALASHPQINKTGVSFAIEVYSARSKDAGSIHRYYNTAAAQNGSVDVGYDTLFRIHSISKVVTVYTILAKLSYKYWHEPVTKYVPELVNQMQNAVNDVDWSEVTLGSLASLMSGISRDCTMSYALVISWLAAYWHCRCSPRWVY